MAQRKSAMGGEARMGRVGRRAYEGRPMETERAAYLLSQVALAQTGLVEGDQAQRAIATVAGTLAA